MRSLPPFRLNSMIHFAALPELKGLNINSGTVPLVDCSELHGSGDLTDSRNSG